MCLNVLKPLELSNLHGLYVCLSTRSRRRKLNSVFAWCLSDTLSVMITNYLVIIQYTYCLWTILVYFLFLQRNCRRNMRRSWHTNETFNWDFHYLSYAIKFQVMTILNLLMIVLFVHNYKRKGVKQCLTNFIHPVQQVSV